MPDERRAFESPDIPDLVISQIARLKEGNLASIEAALCLQAAQHLVAARHAIGLDQRFDDALEVRLLIGRKFRRGQTRDLSALAKLYFAFLRSLLDQGL